MADGCEFNILPEQSETYQCGTHNGNLIRFRIQNISNCTVTFRIAPTSMWSACNSKLGDTFGYDGKYYIYEGFPSTFNPPVKQVPFYKNDTYVDTSISLDYLSSTRSFYAAGLNNDGFFYTDPIDITPVAPQKGELEVWIKPSQAIIDGAKWKLMAYSDWMNGNDRLKGINAGRYTIQFKDITGWLRPSDIIVNIISGEVLYKEANYTDNKKYAISGKIEDHNNKGIYNVVVTFANNYSDTTDSNGNFTISNIPAGTSGYLIPSHSGYTFKPEKQFIVSLYSDVIKNFETEAPLPTVTYTQPNSGTFYVGDSITINWNATNQHHFGLYLYKGGTTEDKQVGTIVLTHDSIDKYYIWKIPSVINDQNNNTHTINGNDYKIKIAVWNGNTTAAMSAGDYCDDTISLFPPPDDNPEEPTISFVSSVDSGNAPLQVDFTVNTKNLIINSCEWDYNNDSIIDIRTIDGNSSHIFKNSGTYNVCVIINDVSAKQYKKCKFISVKEPEQLSKNIVFTPYYPENDAIVSSVMPGGKAMRYYVISDTDRKPVAYTVIKYKFNDNEKVYDAQTDMQGIICIETPTISHSKNFQLSVTDIVGNVLSDQAKFEPCFDVVTRDKSYSLTYCIYFGSGVSFGLKPGIKIGAFQYKKFALSLNAGINISTHLAFDVNGNHTNLILTNKRGVNADFDAFLGIFGKTWSTTLTKPSVKSGFDVGTTIKADYASKYRFQNFNLEDHKFPLAYLILENYFLANYNNLLLRFLLEQLILNIPQYNESTGFNVSVEGNAFAGVQFEVKNPFRVIPGNSVNLSFKAIDSEYLYHIDIEKYFNGMKNLSQGFVFNCDIFNLNLGIQNKFNGDKRKNSTPELSLSNFLSFGDQSDIIGEQNIMLQTSENGNKLIVMEQLLNRSQDDYGLFIEHSDVYETYRRVKTDHPDSIEDLSVQSPMIHSMLNGLSCNLTPKDYNNAFSSFFNVKNGQVECDRFKKVINLSELSVEIQAALIGLNFKAAFEKDFEYISSKSMFIPKKYLLETETYPDGYIQNNDILILENIIKEELERIIKENSDHLETILKKIDDGVEFVITVGKSILHGTLKAIKATKASITRLINNDKKRSYRIAAKNDHFQTVKAQTIGEVYFVRIMDENNNEIKEFSPLELTLKFNMTQLSEAGFSETDASKLRIYRWNSQTGYYHLIGGIVDTENGSVTSSINLPGQYILAIDPSAPEINNFIISDGTSTPTISFQIVDDFSGININSIQLFIDDTEIVNHSNIHQYYNESNGQFTYKINNALPDGEHQIKLIVNDSTGNNKELIQKFNTNDIAPVIEHQPVTSASSDLPLQICANVTDEESIKGVYLHYRPKTNEMPYEIIEMKKQNRSFSEYSAMIPQKHITSFGIQYFIQTIDISGNKAQSSPYDIIIEDNHAPELPARPEVTLMAEGYKIEWEQAEDIDTKGYKIYIGNSLDDLKLFEDIKDHTSIIINGINQNSYVSVSAYDESGNEGNKITLTKLEVIKTQKIPLNSGWNLISLNVEIDNQSPDEVLNSIFSQLVKVKSITKSYDPFMPSFLNNLKAMEQGKGYWINIENDMDLYISGKPLCDNSSHNLKKGWNLIGYNCQSTQAVEEVFSEILSVLVKVKNIQYSYDPDIPPFFNTLKDLIPGEGYWVNVSEDITLHYLCTN
jgi:hypothetical protein